MNSRARPEAWLCMATAVPGTNTFRGSLGFLCGEEKMCSHCRASQDLATSSFRWEISCWLRFENIVCEILEIWLIRDSNLEWEVRLGQLGGSLQIALFRVAP